MRVGLNCERGTRLLINKYLTLNKQRVYFSIEFLFRSSLKHSKNSIFNRLINASSNQHNSICPVINVIQTLVLVLPTFLKKEDNICP